MTIMSVKLSEWEIDYLLSIIGQELRRSKVDGSDSIIVESLDILYHKIQDAHFEMLRDNK
jgi:hypothetical protein